MLFTCCSKVMLLSKITPRFRALDSLTSADPTLTHNYGTGRGIGMIRYLSKYVSRDILDQIYKLYVRPHLDYGDIIYHKYDPQMRLNFTQRLEQTQYSAALAVAGAWRGTSRERLYRELGWEDLYHRRCFRRLYHFYTFIKFRSPKLCICWSPPWAQCKLQFSKYEKLRPKCWKNCAILESLLS